MRESVRERGSANRRPTRVDRAPYVAHSPRSEAISSAHPPLREKQHLVPQRTIQAIDQFRTVPQIANNLVEGYPTATSDADIRGSAGQAGQQQPMSAGFPPTLAR